MAKKKKSAPRYLQSQASWRRNLIREIRAADIEGDNLGAYAAERKLASEESYLRDSIKLLRKYVGGFEASDGYDLNRLAYIPESKLRRVREYAPIIRQETGQVIEGPRGEEKRYFKVVRPRTVRGHRTLEKFTGQTFIPRRKGYVVPIDRADEKVHLVRKVITKKDKRGRRYKAVSEAVEVTRQVGKHISYQRFFRFPEPPQTFHDVIRMTRDMLPEMPDGWYAIQTSNYGSIGVSIRKRLLLQELQAYYTTYDQLPKQGGKDSRGLAETVVGYKLIGMHEAGVDREYRERITRRLAVQKYRQRQRAEKHKRLLRRLRTGKL